MKMIECDDFLQKVQKKKYISLVNNKTQKGLF